MEFERDQIVEIVASLSVVVALVGSMYWIGLSYGGDDGGLAAVGGELLVGSIVGFILLLTVVGVALAFALNDPDEETEDDLETGRTA